MSVRIRIARIRPIAPERTSRVASTTVGTCRSSIHADRAALRASKGSKRPDRSLPDRQGLLDEDVPAGAQGRGSCRRKPVMRERDVDRTDPVVAQEPAERAVDRRPAFSPDRLRA